MIAGDRVRLQPATLAELVAYGEAHGVLYAREVARAHLVDEGMFYLLEEHATGAVVGGGVVWQTGEDEVEPFGFLMPQWQWRGLAVEGMRVLLDHLFTSLPHITRVVAHIVPRNRAAARVARMAGMHRKVVPLSASALAAGYASAAMDTYIITRRRWLTQRTVHRRKNLIIPRGHRAD